MNRDELVLQQIKAIADQCLDANKRQEIKPHRHEF